MKHFNYTARDTSGAKIMGEIVAANAEEALAALQEAGVFATHIEPVPIDERGWGRPGHVVMSVRDKSLLLEIWARLLESGLPMDAVLSQLQTAAPHPSVRRALQQVQWKVRNGVALSESVVASGLFPASWAGMIEEGQKRGNFVGPLLALHKRTEQIQATMREMATALMMPSILVALVFIWVWIFITWLMPAMVTALVELSGTLHPVWGWLESFRKVTFPAAVIGVVVICFAVLFVLRGNRSNVVLGTIPTWIPGGFPILGPLVSKIHLIVISSELQLQMEAGIPLMNALVSLSRSMPNRAIRHQLAQAYRKIWGGVPVWQALGDLPMMPASALGLLVAGHESGKLPEMLGVLVKEASIDLETEAQRLAIKMRSFAVIMSGFIVGVLAISVFMLIFCALDNVSQIPSLPTQ